MAGWKIEDSEKVAAEGCACTAKKDDKINVLVTTKVLGQIGTLTRKYPNLEWLGGLTGRLIEGTYIVEGIILFEQEVRGASCEYTVNGNSDAAKVKKIGWIHSHNVMSAFFSKTDMDNAAQTDGISLVVNNKFEMLGVCRVKLPCGSNTLCETEIKYDYETDAAIASDADKLIKTVPVISSYGYIPQVGFGYDSPSKNVFFCYMCGEKVKKNKFELNGKIMHRNCLKRYKKVFEMQDIQQICGFCERKEDNCICSDYVRG